ncbi:putative bifunctional diguanylate cyclase/phosphodiesterase [Kineococcus sp. SYSU DK001]|uniref:putative bifunctional diguanylate cyclase/phosphodiesterase n=1 Tax=Kineococcus sp. SYSU DK001 TaxID=3383122 RepID=UPI003D7CD926
MNGNLRRALLAAAGVGAAGFLTERAPAHVDGRLTSAVLLLAVLTGTLLLHHRRPERARAMSATSWRSFSAAGVVLVVTAAADLAVGVADGRGFWTGIPLAAGTLAAGPLVLRGLVRWNAQCQHVLDDGHVTTTVSAVLAVTGAGNLLVPHLPADLSAWSWWQVQVWLLTVSLLLVLVGTAVVVARCAGLSGDPRLWSLTGALAALTVVDAFVAVTGGAGVVAVQGAAAAGTLIMGAGVLRACAPGPVVVSAEVPAGGAMAVLATSLVVLAVALAGALDRAALVWAGLAAAGSAASLVRLVRRLADLARARVQARTDDLTGVGNRRALVEEVGRLRTRGQPAALLKIDVDDFGLVNERIGHHGGDDVLVAVATAVGTAAPSGAHTARTAGDTFAVLLPDTGEDAAVGVARHLERALRDLPTPVGLGRPLSVSIGVATAAAGRVHADDLMHRAGAALALAKGGRRGIARYDAALEARTRDRSTLVADLGRALGDAARRDAELRLAYQPQVEVASGAVAGVEALVRWHHPVRGLLSPDRFLDLAEEHGLMDALTAHLLDRAVREAGGWSCGGRPLRLSVNLSAGSLAAEQLLPVVDDVLQRNGFDPRRLVLEITETTLMSDPGLAVEVTGSLVARGVALSIDDYGTGYSSLAYLTDLPATELKLDRAFTLRVTSEPRTAAIVEGTVALAHRLGLRVVAEGVEDAGALEVLRHLGVDETQGYLHARPLDPAGLRDWLSGRAPEPERCPA